MFKHSLIKFSQDFIFLLYRLLSPFFDIQIFLVVKKYVQFILKYCVYARNSQELVPFLDLYPCLYDEVKETPFDAHYFYQSIWLSRNLAIRAPSLHVDIGSDIKMVGVLSAFIEVQFVDYRPLKVNVNNLMCCSGDLLSLPYDDNSVSSISCLHVIEHIGLGRYGDNLNTNGSILALKELQRVTSYGGHLYVSVPIGKERVCFNAHRVFSPKTIISALNDMSLIKFEYVDDLGNYVTDTDVSTFEGVKYSCGFFLFTKF